VPASEKVWPLAAVRGMAGAVLERRRRSLGQGCAARYVPVRPPRSGWMAVRPVVGLRWPEYAESISTGEPKTAPKMPPAYYLGSRSKTRSHQRSEKAASVILVPKKEPAVPSNSLASGLPSGAPDTKSCVKNCHLPPLSPLSSFSHLGGPPVWGKLPNN
jgi:hypothetical protein